MTSPKRTSLSKNEVLAVTGNAGDRSRPLRDLKDRGIGSVVAVSLGPHSFLITAAHLVDSSHPMAIIGCKEELPVNEVRRGWPEDKRTDIGFIEVERQQAESLGLFAGAESVLAYLTPRRRWDLFVHGFPQASYFKVGPRKPCEIVPLVYNTQSIPIDSWDKVWPCPLRQRVDLLLEYQEGERTHVSVQEMDHGKQQGTARVDLRTPHGLSGAGIWLTVVCEGPIWRADPKLVGIQVGVQDEKSAKPRALHGITIDRVLDLIYSQYRDLQEPIEDIRRKSRSFWRRMANVCQAQPEEHGTRTIPNKP